MRAVASRTASEPAPSQADPEIPETNTEPRKRIRSRRSAWRHRNAHAAGGARGLREPVRRMVNRRKVRSQRQRDATKKTSLGDGYSRQSRSQSRNRSLSQSRSRSGRCAGSPSQASSHALRVNILVNTIGCLRTKRSRAEGQQRRSAREGTAIATRPRKITKQSVDSLFAQLNELQSYLASTDTRCSRRSSWIYRVNAPDYHGEQQHEAVRVGAAIFGS